MGKTVILSERRGFFKHWANQFVSAQPSGRAIVIAGNIRRNSSHEQVLSFINNYYARAIQLAGNGGCLIISLGHGGSSEINSTVGMVDLLPNRALRMQREHVMYAGSEVEEGDISVLGRAPNVRVCRQFNRYDFDESTLRPEPPEDQIIDYMNCLGARAAQPRQRFQQAYARIGELLNQERVNEVIFLTCRVGNATDFIDRMSQNWRTRIVAYSRRVAGNRDNDSDNPYYIYLVGEESRKYRDRIPTQYMYRSR